MKAPSILYPTLAKGEIHGPIRCESLDGTELWLPPRSGDPRGAVVKVKTISGKDFTDLIY